MIRSGFKIVLMSVCNMVAHIFNRKTSPAILMYHSFDTQEWKHGVSPKELEKQLDYIRKTRTVVPLLDIAAFVCKEIEVPKNAVAITVDDGYEDTYKVLFPLAQQHNMPFTLFLTTDFSLQSKLGNLSRPKREQILEMVKSGLVTLGVHGHSHVNFPEVLEKGLENEEIEHCRRIIKDEYAQDVTCIAYPAGKYTHEVLIYVKEQGYTVGCTTHINVVRQGDDTLKLSRLVVDRETPLELFKLRLSVGLPLYVAIVSRLKKL